MTDDQRAWASPLDSGCASERYQRAMGYQVDPWNLDECRECDFCGGCQTHFCYRDEKSSVLHMDRFRDFASPGETECGSVGGPPNLVPSQYRPRSGEAPLVLIEGEQPRLRLAALDGELLGGGA